MAYEKKEQLYEGKAKKVYATDDPEVVIVSYKDDATAFNGLKKGYSLMTTPSTFSAGAVFPLTAICIALILPYFTIIFLSAEKFFS